MSFYELKTIHAYVIIFLLAINSNLSADFTAIKYKKSVVFDIHTHYKWCQAEVTTPEQALAFLDAENISHAVVLGKPAVN